ncbi:unnamed protein product, partial [Prorocentrum cordatum]
GRPRGVRDPWPSGTRPLAGPRPPHRLALCLQSGLTAAHAQEMNTAIVNFGEAHNTLIQNKEDYMTSQMTSWHASFFNKHRERQYNRNRQRIMDIKKVIDECRAEISAAAEAGDDDEDDHEGNVS